MSSQNSWNAAYNDGKGELLVGNNTRPVVEPVGADGAYLTADSSTATGVAWSANSGRQPWTPVLSFGGGTTGIVYLIQQGYYVQIGPLVAINGLVQISSKGTSVGGAEISGFPIISSAAVANFAYFSALYGSIVLSALAVAFVLRLGPGFTTAQIFQSRIGFGNTVISTTDANFTDTTTFEFGGVYFI